jgi:hypothetical protein
VRLHVGIKQPDARRLDHQRPALGHSIARIGGQVHDDLLDLHRIRLDSSQFLARNKRQFDVFPDQARQHFCDFFNDYVQVEQLQALHLLSPERQQLPGQVGGTTRGFLDFIHIAA